MQLSISIVLFNTDPSDLINVFDSINNSIRNYHLFLIDNSPTDNLRSLIRDKKVSYLFIGKNIGYGSAHNIAIQKSLNQSKYHLVLNPDIIFDSSVLPKLVLFMDGNQNIGLVMPKVLSPKGKGQYLSKLLPTPLDLILRMAFPRSFLKSQRRRYQLEFVSENKTFEAPSLSGCFMFLRTNIFKELDPFDERFFMYAEDIDLSRRINEKFKTIYFPKVEIIHKHAKESFKSFKYLVLHSISAIKYFNKWGWFFDKKRQETNKRILKQLNYKG